MTKPPDFAKHLRSIPCYNQFDEYAVPCDTCDPGASVILTAGERYDVAAEIERLQTRCAELEARLADNRN